IDEHKSWTNAEEYIQALEARPLGPNVAAFIGHSDMRAATMGLDRATQKRERPTKSEQAQMERMLSEALRAGFVGMSLQQLLFDKLDGDVCRSRTLPSTYAKPRELRRLRSLLRRAGRILQWGPDIQNPLNLGSQLAQSLGIVRNPLKTSLLSAADVKANPYAIWAMGPAARLINRLGGNFRWQHLPVPFEVYADGIDLVVFEEFGGGAGQLCPAVLDRGLNEVRHVVGVRRHRPGLRSADVRPGNHRRDRRRRDRSRPIPRRHRREGRSDRRSAQAHRGRRGPGR